MSNGGKSPRNAQEIQENFEKERISAAYMDEIYRSRGHEVVSRDGRQGYDLILLRCGEQEERIEEKYRYQHYDDLLIEVCQDIVSGNPGWFARTQCDYLHYIFCDPETYRPLRFYRLDWKRFRTWYIEYLKNNRHPPCIISPRGYGLTANLGIAHDLIPRTYLRTIVIPEPEEEETF